MEEEFLKVFFDNISDDVLTSIYSSGELDDLCIELTLENALHRRPQNLC